MVKESKIYSVLRTFSPEDFREFRTFLDSPYFVSRSNVKSLYDLLLKQYKHKGFRNVDASFMYKKLFPKEFRVKGYSDSTMRFLLHKLLQASQDFLTVKGFMKNKLLANEVLRGQLVDKGLFDLFDINVSKAEKLIEKESNFQGSQNLLRYYLEKDKLNIHRIVFGHKVKKGNQSNVKEYTYAAKTLFNFFVSEIAGFVDNYVKFCKAKNIIPDKDLIEYMYATLDSEKLNEFHKAVSGKDEVNIFELYKVQSQAFMNMENDSLYDNYKKLLLDNILDLDIDLKNYFGARLIDYCVLKRKLKPNDKKYALETFSVYKLLIENGLYLHSKSKGFPADLFTNVIVGGIRVGELDWTDEFIDRYKSKLPKEIRNDCSYYGKARIAFARKDFLGAIGFLKKIKNEYFVFSVHKKAFLIMSEYELSNDEEALKLADSFRHFLDNSDYVSERLKDENKKFNFFLIKILREKSKPDRDSIGYLKVEILNQNDFMHKDWLLSKVGELIPHKQNQPIKKAILKRRPTRK